MPYTIAELNRDILDIAREHENMTATRLVRKNAYMIKYKQDRRYLSGEEVLEKIKELYYQKKHKTVDWKLLKLIAYDVFDKYIEIYFR